MMLIECACIAAVVVCGCDVAGNDIGDAGAVALAKALQSGQCKLDGLSLTSESA